jgi:drug/metabolite transporter (DMT)-like permease
MTHEHRIVPVRAGGHEPLPLVALCVTLLSWSCGYPVIRLALAYFSPAGLSSLRYALAATLIMTWAACTRPALPRLVDLPRFALCGGVGIALYTILFNMGEQSVTAGAASLLLNISPLLTAIMAVVFMREKLPLAGWVGSGLSFLGVAIIGGGQPGGFSFGSGASCILAAALCTALYYVLQKPLIGRYGPLPTTAWILLCGAVALLPWLPGAIKEAQGHGMTPWILMLVLAVFPSVVGYAAWAHVVGRMGVARSAGFLYLDAPTVLVMAYFMLGEVPTLPTLLGGAVVMGGVLVAQLFGRMPLHRKKRGEDNTISGADGL